MDNNGTDSTFFDWCVRIWPIGWHQAGLTTDKTWLNQALQKTVGFSQSSENQTVPEPGYGFIEQTKEWPLFLVVMTEISALFGISDSA